MFLMFLYLQINVFNIYALFYTVSKILSFIYQ